MTSPPPVEVELKYLVRNPAGADDFLGAPSLGPFSAGPTVRESRCTDSYLDTADGALARAGLAARARRTATEALLTVKATTTEAGALQRRTELEGAAGEGLDPHAWPPSAARSLLLELCGDAPLVELATVRQLRRRRDLVAGGTRVELSLDQVEVLDGGRVVDRFTELELELREGPEEPLLELRAILDLDPRLAPAAGSKLERALRAAAEVNAPPSDPGPLVPLAKSPGVLPDDTVAEAGRKVLRFHLARMIAREPGTRLGRDPEELHGMRVATRRMRAAWRVFGDGFRADRTKRFRRRLRTVAGRLGAVRDRDVLIDALEAYQAALPDHEAAAIQPLIEAWRNQRDEARELLLHELDSDAYRRWLDDYREFTLHEGLAAGPVPPTSPHRVRDVFPARIWQAYGQVRAFEPVLRWADVATLHELRIAAKRLRYTLEFVRETLGPEAAPLIARIVVLQDHLGLLNDADVAATLARTFLVEHAGELDALETQVIGRYLVTQEQAVTRLRRTVGGPWRGVGGPGFRRALGRLTAGL